jgi:hypothetical protein
VVFATEQDRPDVTEARAGWRAKFAGVRPEDLVFVDESGANTAMHTTHGYAPAGERLVD